MINPEVLANASEIYADLQVEDCKPYLPANGTEGDIFEARWCERCTQENDDYGIWCDIHSLALRGEQPKEWIYYENKPMCTAFKKREGA